MLKRRALFIDRDGVINKMVRNKNGFDSPSSPEEVKLIEGIDRIIRFANEKEIPVVEISNQPQVAKGKLTKKESEIIEGKIHKLLKNKKAKVDKIYICPHHPKAVIPSLRKICDCRKPEPGLLIKASKSLNINLKKSIFLGDKATDVQAGKAAGTKTIVYLHGQDEPEKVKRAYNAKADYKFKNMEEILNILKDFFTSK